MAASDNLNEQLFHGTAGKFRPGDIILPASKTGVSPNWGARSKNNPDLAHATDDLQNARYFASVARLHSGFDDPTARARVYQVEPVNPEEARWQEKRFAGGAGGSSAIREHVSSEGYRVVKHVWTGRKRKTGS